MDKLFKLEHSDFDWSIDIDIDLPCIIYNKIVNDMNKIVFISSKKIKEKIEDLLNKFNVKQFIIDVHNLFYLQEEHITIFNKYNIKLSLIYINSFNHIICENDTKYIDDLSFSNSYFIKRRKTKKNLIDYIEVDYFIEDDNDKKNFILPVSNVYIVHAISKITVYDYHIKYNICRLKIHTSGIFNNKYNKLETLNFPIELIDIVIPCKKSDSHQFIRKNIKLKDIPIQESLHYKSMVKNIPSVYYTYIDYVNCLLKQVIFTWMDNKYVKRWRRILLLATYSSLYEYSLDNIIFQIENIICFIEHHMNIDIIDLYNNIKVYFDYSNAYIIINQKCPGYQTFFEEIIKSYFQHIFFVYYLLMKDNVNDIDRSLIKNQSKLKKSIEFIEPLDSRFLTKSINELNEQRYNYYNNLKELQNNILEQLSNILLLLKSLKEYNIIPKFSNSFENY